jgi:ferredoxin-NADP reductase
MRQYRSSTLYLCERVNVVDTLSMSALRNCLSESPEACHSVFVVSGIGITPIRAIILQMQAQSASLESIMR